MHKFIKGSNQTFDKLRKNKCIPIWVLAALIGGTGLFQESLSGLLLAKPVEATPLIHLSRSSFIAEAVARSGPAVVTLETKRTVISQRRGSFPPGLLMDPYFQHFFIDIAYNNMGIFILSFSFFF